MATGKAAGEFPEGTSTAISGDTVPPEWAPEPAKTGLERAAAALLALPAIQQPPKRQSGPRAPMLLVVKLAPPDSRRPRMHKGSMRAQIYRFIEERHPYHVTVNQIRAQFPEERVRGHLNKLIEAGYIERA